MADHDPLQDLRHLAGAAEHRARPLPVDEVRARGTRRRRRRHAAVAGTVLSAALVVGYGAVLNGSLASSLREPPPIAQNAPATASPSKARTVTTANLMSAAELPAPQGGSLVEYEENARPLDRVSVCLPDGLGALEATAAVSRSFKAVYDYGPGEQPDPRAPLVDEPTSYAVALQFPDAATAARAAETYRGWLTDCRAGRGAGADLEVLDLGFGWTPVPGSAGQGEAAEVVYREPGAAELEAYWESSGLTVVGDRLMITVHVFYAPESYFSLDEKLLDGESPHPQVGLVQAAARRLAR